MLKILVGVEEDKEYSYFAENEKSVKGMTEGLKDRFPALNCYYEWDKVKGKLFFVINEESITEDHFKDLAKYFTSLSGF